MNKILARSVRFLPALAILIVGLASFWPTPVVTAAGPTPSPPHVVDMPAAGAWVARLVERTAILPRPSRQAEDRRQPLAGYALIGLVETDGRQLALISFRGETRTVEVGERLDGFQLMQILQDRLVFARDGDETVLRLER